MDSSMVDSVFDDNDISDGFVPEPLNVGTAMDRITISISDDLRS